MELMEDIIHMLVLHTMDWVQRKLEVEQSMETEDMQVHLELAEMLKQQVMVILVAVVAVATTEVQEHYGMPEVVRDHRLYQVMKDAMQ